MQKIGIGYENYREFIEKNLYYVDKTMLIRDVVEKGGKVTLFTRPRRFGKTLALSMLRTFFEFEVDSDGKVTDKSRYFEGKEIMNAPKEILSMMGQYPAINLSLKSAKQDDFISSFKKLRESIISEYKRHSYLWTDEKLPENDRENLRRLTIVGEDSVFDDEKGCRAEIARYSTSIKLLCEALKSFHGKNVLIFIDEYDVPLENAYYEGFYGKMVGFMRSLFESCLKTNDALEFAVITGCLRISKESIFTGMNNLTINSIRAGGFDEAFGFTATETMKMLKDYGVEANAPEVKRWYDGYVFGETEIYNPWSITRYVYGVVIENRKFPEPYWSNTSSNQIIRDMIASADDNMREELNLLIGGGTIEKQVHEDITYEDIGESEDNLWNFLYLTGYMKKVSERIENRRILIRMKIPNEEILCIYENQIRTWFETRIKKTDQSPLIAAILNGDAGEMENYLNRLLEMSISTFDSTESFYHGFLLSMFHEVPDYVAKSNREEGNGRPDIVLYPKRHQDSAIIFELKVRKKFNEMQGGIEEAFRQIRDQRYEEGVLNDGYTGSLAYGICFCKKNCMVKKYIPSV
ncbi:MAG: AAA family ATPase [Clostridia bacterium]|nr:AAA family ATPase [Clostridia bacterium]